MLSQDSTAQGRKESTEYEVKAVFLSKFLIYADWPKEERFQGGTITIGILGEDPFGDNIKAIEGRSVMGKRIQVRHFRKFDVKEDFSACWMVFVSPSERKRYEDILKNFKSAPILTVGEDPDFLKAGGMICFATAAKRIVFDINQAASNAAGVRIQTDLLRSARKLIRKEKEDVREGPSQEGEQQDINHE
jgi:hypothetical protein